MLAIPRGSPLGDRRLRLQMSIRPEPSWSPVRPPRRGLRQKQEEVEGNSCSEWPGAWPGPRPLPSMLHAAGPWGVHGARPPGCPVTWARTLQWSVLQLLQDLPVGRASSKDCVCLLSSQQKNRHKKDLRLECTLYNLEHF